MISWLKYSEINWDEETKFTDRKAQIITMINNKNISFLPDLEERIYANKLIVHKYSDEK